MKRLTALFIGLYISLAATGQHAKKAVFIIVDGIPADVMEKLHTPWLDSIAREGHYLRAHVGGEKDGYSQTPTISAVGYNSLLTGTWVNKHNVWDNDIAAPNYNYWTIYRILKTQQPGKKLAIFSSWTDNRTKLVGDGLPATGNIRLDYKYDGYELDTVQFPHDKESAYMERIDALVAREAASCILEKGPDLSWVYLEYTDDMGHRYGDSEQFYSAIRKMDEKVGKIWKAIQQRRAKYKEDWLIVITTDHGRSEKTGKDHGGQSPRQRSTWIVTNYKQLNSYARYYEPGIVDIMPTIATFMGIRLPEDVRRESDGISLIGDVSLAQPAVNRIQNNLDVTWRPLKEQGTVKVWLSLTNRFREGGRDDYRLVAEVPLSSGHASIDVQQLPSSFYKVVLEGPDNSVNRWVVQKEK